MKGRGGRKERRDETRHEGEKRKICFTRSFVPLLALNSLSRIFQSYHVALLLQLIFSPKCLSFKKIHTLLQKNPRKVVGKNVGDRIRITVGET
jgi:hypothetical protein